MPGQYLPVAFSRGYHAAFGGQARLELEIDSAGTGNWHVGGPPDRRSVKVARERGIDISQQVCRVLNLQDFDDFDYIFVMDKSNLANVKRLAPNAEAANKVSLLLVDKEVPDPFLTMRNSRLYLT